MRPFRFTYASLAALFLVFTFALPGHPQRGTPPPTYIPGTTDAGTRDPRITSEPDSAIKGIEVRQQHARNDERQKRLVSDTDKLLALATQLHDDVGKTDKNILSLDVVKRADEIEKLAHSVKERMKG